MFRKGEILLKIITAKYNIAQDPTAPMTGRTHSDESKSKISDAMIRNQSNSKAIEVFDNKTNQTTNYNSFSEAAKALNINKAVITNYFKNNQVKAYKGRYTFKQMG
jgi:group I intron endonuclease